MKKNVKVIIAISVAVILLAVSVVLGITLGVKDNSIYYSFVTNGATEIADMKVEEGEIVTLPKPEKTGYAFLGWYRNETFSGKAVEKDRVVGPATFYAKWEKMYLLTLDVDGGTLDKTQMYLKKGANVYLEVENLVPEKGDLTFGAWFYKNVELRKTQLMPENDITITAKYKVDYEIRLIDEEGTPLKQIKLSDYVGTKIEANETFDGYVPVSNSNEKLSMNLTENASSNVLKQYFKRADIVIKFNPNYPDGRVGTPIQDGRAEYGTPIKVPYDLECVGYMFVGWKDSNGKIYETGYIKTLVENNDYNWTEDEASVSLVKSDTLVGVWAKARKDVFKGDDIVYLFHENAEFVYLVRGGKIYECDYDAKYKEFTLKTDTGVEVSSGKITENDTFVYVNPARAEYMSKLYVIGEGIIDDHYIQLDAYNGLTYFSTEGNSTGSYTIADDDVTYFIQFTSGPKMGTSMTIIMGDVVVSGVTEHAFQIRNDEDVAYGELLRVAFVSGSIPNFYYPVVRLDGYGNAYFNVDGRGYSSSYYYTRDGDVITFMDNRGNTQGVAKIEKMTSTNGEEIYTYGYYTQELDRTFNIGGSASNYIKLDGMFSAVYGKESGNISGYYEVKSSVFGGYIVTFYEVEAVGEDEYNFIPHIFHINPKTVTEDGENGEVIENVVYTTEKKGAGYGEYYFRENFTQASYSPLIVLNSIIEGQAAVYTYNSEDGTFVKVLEGYYDAVKGVEGIYEFERDGDAYTDKYLETSKYPLAEITSFVFGLDTAGSYPVSYWLSYSTENGEVVLGEKLTDGKDTIQFISAYAIYEKEGVKTAYMIQDAGSYYILFNDTAEDVMFAVFDAKAGTFEILKEEPYKMSLVDTTGMVQNKTYIQSDGRGNVKLVEDEVETDGTVETLDEEKGIFKYTFGEKVLQVVRVYHQQYGLLYVVYNAEYEKTYTLEDGSKLTLDGYFQATYTPVAAEDEEDDVEGNYFLNKDGAVHFISTTFDRYFDVKNEDSTATVRGVEYNTYDVVYNQFDYDGWILDVDGYGNYKLYKEKFTEEEKISGTYDFDVANGRITLSTFENDGWEVSFDGILTSNGYFVVSNGISEKTFQNVKDLTKFVIDDVGNAYKYSVFGTKDAGSYAFITENLLYFMNNAKTDACLYIYNLDEGTVEPVVLEAKSYYSKDLKALKFTKYGYVQINGESISYYYVDNGVVTVYTEFKEGVTGEPNKFGFVAKTYDLGETVIIDDVTYYETGESSIEFLRNSSDYLIECNIKGITGKWTVKEVEFTPVGSEEFAVSGTVLLHLEADGGQEAREEVVKCTIVRERNDEENLETYIAIKLSSGWYYRLDVDLAFGGDNVSTYEITRARYMLELDAYIFLDMYAYVASMIGTAAANTLTNEYGTIVVSSEVSVDGTHATQYVTGKFGKDSGLVGYDGNIVSFEGKEFEFINLAETQMKIVFKGFDKNGDDVTYCLYINLRSHNSFINTLGYEVLAFTVESELQYGDYTVTVDRVLYSSGMKVEVGSVYETVSIETSAGNVKAENDVVVFVPVSQGKILYSVENAEGIKYYVVTFDYTATGLDAMVLPYSGVTVEVYTVTRVKKNAQVYVDYSEEKDAILSMTIHNTKYGVVECTVVADAEDTYDVTLTNGKKYRVVLANGVLDYSEIIEENE